MNERRTVAQQNAERSDVFRSPATGAEWTKWEELRLMQPFSPRTRIRWRGIVRETYKRDPRLDAIRCVSQPRSSLLRPCRIVTKMC